MPQWHSSLGLCRFWSKHIILDNYIVAPYKGDNNRLVIWPSPNSNFSPNPNSNNYPNPNPSSSPNLNPMYTLMDVITLNPNPKFRSTTRFLSIVLAP